MLASTASAFAVFARVRLKANPSASSSYATDPVSQTALIHLPVASRRVSYDRNAQDCSPACFLFDTAFAPAPLICPFPCFPAVFGRPLTGSGSCTMPLVNGASSLSSSLELLLRLPREGSLIICGLLINCSGARVAYAVIDAAAEVDDSNR